MPFENLRTFLRLHPDATITKVDHPTQSIFFKEEGREWVMIFEGTNVVGVWDMTPSEWEEDSQDQMGRPTPCSDHIAATTAAFGGWNA